MIRLDLLNVGLVEETGGILVVLRARDQARLLVIETGLPEGRSIALAAAGERDDRPQTQDLLHEVIRSLGARVQEASIDDFRDETYYASLVLVGRDGRARKLDARPSDAIGLALRAGAPIFVADEVLAEMGLPADRQGRFAELFQEEDEPPGERVVH